MFKPKDRLLFNTGFWDGFASVENPNPFWCLPGEKQTLESSKDFLKNHHQDRVFAEAALIGMSAAIELNNVRPDCIESYWEEATAEEKPKEKEAAKTTPLPSVSKKS